MYKHLAGAIERIQYQVSSPLFRDLTHLFQDSMDLLDTNGILTRFSGYKLQTEVSKVLIKFKFPEKIKAICAAHLNHVIEDVFLEVVGDPNAAVASGFEFSKNFTLYQSDYYYEVATTKKLSDEYKDLIADLVSNTDTTSGKLRKNVNSHYKSHMYLTTGLFTIHCRYANTEAMTAAECAAIVLHELGHTMTHLESLYIAFQKSAQLATMINDLPKKLTNQNVDELYDTLSHEVKKVTDFETRRRLDLVFDRIRYNRKLDGSAALTLYTVSLIALAFAGMFYANDLLTTDVDQSHFERITDEFATQHGAAADLASALHKLYTIWEIGKSHGFNTILSKSKALTLLVEKLTLINNVMTYGLMSSIKDYDPIVRRLRLMAQNTTEELKDRELPAEIREQLVETIRRAKAIADEYASRDYVKAREWFWGSLLRISRPGTTLQALVDGNLAADYQRLQELTKDLIQSPFAYHQARLQILKDRNKILNHDDDKP